MLHSFDASVGDPGFWNPRVRAPQCLNPPAARTVLREMLKRSEWIMAGVLPAEIGARTRRGYASGELVAPEPGAMAFMLSPRQYLGDKDPHWVPHVVCFFDASVPSASFGVDAEPSTVIDLSADDPSATYRTILVPVRRWSDGAVAMPGAGR